MLYWKLLTILYDSTLSIMLKWKLYKRSYTRVFASRYYIFLKLFLLILIHWNGFFGCQLFLSIYIFLYFTNILHFETRHTTRAHSRISNNNCFHRNRNRCCLYVTVQRPRGITSVLPFYKYVVIQTRVHCGLQIPLTGVTYELRVTHKYTPAATVKW